MVRLPSVKRNFTQILIRKRFHSDKPRQERKFLKLVCFLKLLKAGTAAGLIRVNVANLGRCEGKGRLGRDSAEASQRRPYPARGIMKQFYTKNQFHM